MTGGGEAVSGEVVAAVETETERTAEILLSRLLTRGAIVAAIVEEHGVSESAAVGAIQRVTARWSEEEPTATRLARRRQVRAAVEELYRSARSRTKIIETETLGEDGQHYVQRKEVEDPDRMFCLRALDMLARLDGLYPSEMAMGGGAAARANEEIEEGAAVTLARLEAWLDTLPEKERADVVDTLLQLEEAAEGSVAAFVAGKLSTSQNGHENGNGSHNGNGAAEGEE